MDHHDYKEPVARKYLIGKMGSALTHLYYLLNPLKLEILKNTTDENEEISGYIKKFN